MGIQGLTKLLSDNAPQCVKEQKFDSYFGRKIAVDASMHLYQFMMVVGRSGDQLLANEAGEVTSHLLGMFYRTARMLEAGIKPVYVFDGKPPELKKALLATRKERRDDATEELKQAQEAGDQDAIERASKRTVKVTKEHNDECKKLLRLMGVPVIEAPSEAEAQCASMAAEDLVYGVATEDMDCLTFGAPRLIRHLMAAQSSNLAIMEFNRSKALEDLGITSDQFIDLCILCGCDYASSIKGIGPVRALQLIQKHKTIDAIISSPDFSSKYQIPEPWPFAEAREFFRNPEVLKGSDVPALKWSAPDEAGLIQFLVTEKNFSEERVKNTVKKILAAKGKANQGRMESFFKPIAPPPKPAGEAGAAKPGDKRKDAPGAKGAAAKGPAAKKGKAAPFGKKK